MKRPTLGSGETGTPHKDEPSGRGTYSDCAATRPIIASHEPTLPGKHQNSDHMAIDLVIAVGTDAATRLRIVLKPPLVKRKWRDRWRPIGGKGDVDGSIDHRRHRMQACRNALSQRKGLSHLASRASLHPLNGCNGHLRRQSRKPSSLATA